MAPNGGASPADRHRANAPPDRAVGWAAGVTLLTIADGRDDIGTTVSAFIPVSLDPPLVAVSLIATPTRPRC